MNVDKPEPEWFPHHGMIQFLHSNKMFQPNIICLRFPVGKWMPHKKLECECPWIITNIPIWNQLVIYTLSHNSWSLWLFSATNWAAVCQPRKTLLHYTIEAVTLENQNWTKLTATPHESYSIKPNCDSDLLNISQPK